MLGLHNILLLASSQQQAQNPHTISSDHHHPHNNNHPTNLRNQDCNFNGSTDPWSLNKCQELSIVGDEISGTFGTCTDCGNKAKKECKYRRCRTCCKSRGYDCSTHVKSTWVPASRRRERHQLGGGGGGGSSGSSSGGVKRPRIVSSGATTSNSLSSNAAAAPASLCFDTGSSHQDPSFKQSLPGKVKAPAVFRCIRVTAISGEEAEVLYQATVNICGHVFKGFLYNQGIDEKKVYPCISNVHMESSTNGREFSVPIVKPSNAYPASGNQRLFEAAGNE
ncbi:protein LATERAL ROOT PRIMORDIUM 1-like isoform X1 [Tripterygium wilfordii]|uniref:Protein LATERAL ROOT PRIMORDIUM 1-like isoform X1 n=1 Tax=Tripterygium wilfordii TaxID=458696 RepID=A0A7J7CHW5_TRIWF|nr:protein SHI RELATED SEQUENCE 6-like [Tripterygium wilfordii]KAF5733638.1 protein LATERAL ROOT PRIMORDIUM 1-like isoform X1 [Tripterygium wilfordii]